MLLNHKIQLHQLLKLTGRILLPLHGQYLHPNRLFWLIRSLGLFGQLRDLHEQTVDVGLFELLAAQVVVLAQGLLEVQDGRRGGLQGGGGGGVQGVLRLEFLLKGHLARWGGVRFLGIRWRGIGFVLRNKRLFYWHLWFCFVFFFSCVLLGIFWFFLIFVYCTQLI